MSAKIGTNIVEASDILRRGGLVAIPTETVYGLAADARNLEAVRKVFEVKQRPTNHPVIVHLAEARWAKHWAEQIPEIFWTLATKFWPGPLTMVVRRHPSVPDLITGGQTSVALRVPAHPLSLELLNKLGRSLVAPSANRFGRISPTSAEHVSTDLGADVGYVLDGGVCEVGLESTILDLTCSPARILRPGLLGREALARFIPLGDGPSEVRAPGTLAQHYAPTCPAYRIDAAALGQDLGPKLALLSLSACELGFAPFRHLNLPQDPTEYGQALYASLRQLEQASPRAIIVQNVPETAEWEAVSDRIRRATQPWAGQVL
jgi:L-threonylcarbamoyladenylate synthase